MSSKQQHRRAVPPKADVPIEERRIEVDRTQFLDRARYTCPRRHSDWDRTNAHLWCATCARLSENVDPDVDPEYYHLLDKRENVLIPYAYAEVRP